MFCNIQIEYNPSKDLVLADALCRKPFDSVVAKADAICRGLDINMVRMTHNFQHLDVYR